MQNHIFFLHISKIVITYIIYNYSCSDSMFSCSVVLVRQSLPKSLIHHPRTLVNKMCNMDHIRYYKCVVVSECPDKCETCSYNAGTDKTECSKCLSGAKLNADSKTCEGNHFKSSLCRTPVLSMQVQFSGELQFFLQHSSSLCWSSICILYLLQKHLHHLCLCYHEIATC